MKTLQRRRASGASVHGELQPTFAEGTSLVVQLVLRDILDAADMPLLARRMPVVSKPEGESSTSMSAWIRIFILQLLASDVLRDVGKRHALTSKLYWLGFPQQGQVTRIPLEDAGGQLRQEDVVQGVGVGGAGRAEAADEVPDIQSHR